MAMTEVASEAAPAAPRGVATTRWHLPTITCLATFVLWEVLVRAFEVPAYLLPAPSKIMVRIANDWSILSRHFWITLQEVITGFLLSAVIGIAIAAVLLRFRFLSDALYPLLVSSQTIPKVAIAPLLVVWFGFGTTPKIIITFLICFFPIVIDTLVGFRSLPQEVLWLARSTGASAWDTLIKIRIPAALPNIFAGLKVASTLAVVGAVVGEFVGSDGGVGYLLITANGLMDVELAFACVIILSAMGIAVFGAVQLLERLLLPWHISNRAEQGPSSR